jgi:flagellar biosynthesis GTPase FlhF
MRKIYLFNGEVGSGVTTTLLKFAAIRNTENTLLVDLNSYTLGHKEKMCTGAVLLNAQYVNGTAVDIEELMMQIDNAPTVFIDCGCKRLLLPKELYCSLSQR